jgi:hypothetical protein
MRIEKAVLRNAVQKLAERAEDCFDRAEIQHASADKQHASADAQHVSADAQHVSAHAQHASADKQHASAEKQHASADELVTLGVALEADAVALNGEIEMVAEGSSAPVKMKSDDVKLVAGALPPAIPN